MARGEREGDPVEGQPCPRCRREAVVYNGNYFCTKCPWAMPESGRPARIVKAYLVQRLLSAQKAGNVKEEERMSGYLISLGFVDSHA